MKIAMIGSGAAGSVFASYLRRGGADITLVDPYKEHMDKVAKDGMILTIHPDTDIPVTGFKTAYSADELDVMDIVIFMTKATQLDNAVRGAKKCIGENTVLVSLLNGLGNDDILRKYHPADHIVYGSGGIGTGLKAPGNCVAFPNEGPQITFGPLERSEATEAVCQYMLKCFTDGGARALFTYDIAEKVWRKAILNCAVNTVCTCLRFPVGQIDEDPDGHEMYYRVIKECCDVANAKGVPVDFDYFMNEYFPPFMVTDYDYYPSMAQDVLMNKRQTEISVLNAAIVRYGKELGIPTPTNEVLSMIVQITERNYERLYKE